MTKPEMRAFMRARRNALTSEMRAWASHRVCAALQVRTLPEPVAVYLATDREIDLTEYIRAARLAGTRLVAPRWNGATYELVELQGLSAECLRLGPMGVREPVSACRVAPAAIGSWIVPGLAFTRTGVRLGYGGGWYDRLLAAASPQAPRIGVAHGFQVVDELPTEPHDRPLTDLIVAEEVVSQV